MLQPWIAVFTAMTSAFLANEIRERELFIFGKKRATNKLVALSEYYLNSYSAYLDFVSEYYLFFDSECLGFISNQGAPARRM